MSEVTKPVLLDDTGKNILEQLRLIAQTQGQIIGTKISIAPNRTDGELLCAIMINNDVYGIYSKPTDGVLDLDSENPIQNKVVFEKFLELEDKINVVDSKVENISGLISKMLDEINRTQDDIGIGYVPPDYRD